MKSFKPKVCKECGSVFIPASNNQLYCKKPHYRSCPVCATPVLIKPDRLHNPNPVACSYKCRAILTKNTSIKRYGCSAPGCSKQAREKAKKTMLIRYGVEYSMQSEDIRQKQVSTVISRYGVDNVSKLESTIQKRKNTCLQKYGYISNLASPELRSLYSDIVEKKYGNRIPLRNESIRNKFCRTCVCKYGVSWPFQSNEIKKKIYNTNLLRYGKQFAASSDFVRNKIKSTCKQRYGVENPFQSESIICKIRDSFIRKYGVLYPLQNAEIKKKQHKSMRILFGDEHALKNQELLYKMLQTRDSTLSERIKSGLLPQISKINKFTHDYLLDRGVECEYEFRIGRFYYDLHLAHSNVLIELNPSYTHSTVPSFYNKSGKDKYYHYYKSINALKNGYICIHVFDWTDLISVLNAICNKCSIYAPIVHDPILHWYHSGKSMHIIDDMYNHQFMIEHGYLPVYDSGQEIFIK